MHPFFFGQLKRLEIVNFIVSLLSKGREIGLLIALPRFLDLRQKQDSFTTRNNAETVSTSHSFFFCGTMTESETFHKPMNFLLCRVGRLDDT